MCSTFEVGGVVNDLSIFGPPRRSGPVFQYAQRISHPKIEAMVDSVVNTPLELIRFGFTGKLILLANSDSDDC
jgi:hypothetical protein